MSLKICSEVFVSSEELPFFKGTETTSAMSLSLPDIMMGVRCEACVACMRITRKQRRRPATSEDPDISLNVHPTDKLLSQKRAAWVFDILDVRHSSARQFITSPARLRSLILRVPSLNMSFTFCGQYYCHMICPILFRTHLQTTPVPITQLSEYPM